MKKIKLENYTDPKPGSIFVRDKSYWVWLGNGVKRSFSNRKHAEAFLVATNRFLNQKVFELNRLYVEVFAEYRRLWFYFDKSQTVINNRIEANLEWTNKKFNLMIDISSHINGNFTSFQNMRVIIDNLRDIVNELMTLQKQKNNWVEKYNLAVIAARLDELEKALNDYEAKPAD